MLQTEGYLAEVGADGDGSWDIITPIDPGVNLKSVEKRSDRDSTGAELTLEQQEYFRDSVVRDAQGRLLVMYHGTPNGGFTKFRSGTYFTQNPEYADVYQNPGAYSISTKKGANAPMTYRVYLDIKKPFDTRNARERNIFRREFYRKYGTGTPLADSGLPDWVDGMDLQEFIEEMGYDYDGLILDEGGVGGYGDAFKSRGLSYVVFSPEQVKSIDNKNPTSDPDYQYSDRDAGAEKVVQALEKQKKALNADAESLAELIRLRGDIDRKESTVYSAARYLSAYHGVIGSKKDPALSKELAKLLKGFYSYLDTEKDLSWEQIEEKAKPVTEWIFDHTKAGRQRSEYARDVLAEIRSKQIRLTEAERAQAAEGYKKLRGPTRKP